MGAMLLKPAQSAMFDSLAILKVFRTLTMRNQQFLQIPWLGQPASFSTSKHKSAAGVGKQDPNL